MLQSMRTGRRTLETRFRRVMGRTLLDEIHRACIERAKIILALSNRSLATVAREAGFRDNQHMWTVFQKGTGVSPAAYRRAKKNH